MMMNDPVNTLSNMLHIQGTGEITDRKRKRETRGSNGGAASSWCGHLILLSGITWAGSFTVAVVQVIRSIQFFVSVLLGITWAGSFIMAAVQVIRII